LIPWSVVGWIACVCVLGAPLAAPLAAAPEPNVRGLERLQAGDPLAAGLLWFAAAQEQSREENGPGSLRQAALSAVLATIAFERAKNGRAYIAWSQAVRWWLEAGTSWEVERAALGRRVAELQGSLRGAEVAASNPAPTATELQLLALASATGFLDYPGPRPGLPPPEEETGLPIPVQRDYFARPLGVGEEENSVPEARGGHIPEEAAVQAPDPSPSPVRNPAPGPLGQGFPSAGGGSDGADRIEPGPVQAPPPPLAFPPDRAEPDKAEPVRHQGDVEQAPGAVARPGVEERSLAAADMDVARTAWQYFVAAREENTGLYSSVHGYHYATLWDLGSGLAGLVAAEQLHILEAGSFHREAVLFLTTLFEMSLYKGELPNREYQTQSGRMVDLANHLSPEGSGWSALDLGRLLIWLRITADGYPDLRPLVEKVVKRFDFTRLSADREMHGALLGKSGESLNQEGRLGYEQYAAAGYALWGVSLPLARDYEEVAFVPVYGLRVPRDRRETAYLTSDPFVLAGLELGGIDATFKGFTETVYAVQKRRFEETQILTAAGEDALDRAPWFLYNAVLVDDRPWACQSANGRDASELRSLSTKAAFGWAALYKDDYGQRLRRAASPLVHPRFGFYAGLYERGGETNKSLNVNTNAVILEAMLFLKRGGRPFLDPQSIPGPLGQEPQRGIQR
jgi:hypothetical protein